MQKLSNQGIMGKADTHVHTKYSGLHRMGVLKFPESVSEPKDVIARARSAAWT
jgi:predicted metal-dependent phosphoesterase TrpH